MNCKAADYRKFEIPGVARFQDAEGGLVRVDVMTPLCRGQMFLHGAHVAAFCPSGMEPVLFLSDQSLFEAGKPIRGGVPVIFPWFGPREGQPESPAHGFARTMIWEMESLECVGDGAVGITLTLRSNEETRKLWPHDFELRFHVSFGRELEMNLEVTNRSGAPFTFEEALHTYFAVSDIRAVTSKGFENAHYLDKTDGAQRKFQDSSPVRMTGETDRVYLDTRTTCAVEDASKNRRIVVEKSGSDTTVLWNPWFAKAVRLPDFGDDEWPGMMCIETANAVSNAVTLGHGKTHAMSTRIRVEPL